VKQSRIKSQFGHARFAPIVLKKSPMNNSEPFPRNNDSIAAGILNHCYITKARLDRKLQAKYALRLFQHNPPLADISETVPGIVNGRAAWRGNEKCHFVFGPRLRHAISSSRGAGRTLKALIRCDGGVHPAILHHIVRRTEAEIVHMIGNIEPAMHHALRDDEHITDRQFDFA